MRLTCPSYFISKRSCRAPGCWEFLDRTGCRQQYICGSLPGYLGCKLSIQRPDKSLRTCKTIAQTPNEQLSKITAVFGDVVSSTQSTVSSFTGCTSSPRWHPGGSRSNLVACRAFLFLLALLAGTSSFRTRRCLAVKPGSPAPACQASTPFAGKSPKPATTGSKKLQKLARGRQFSGGASSRRSSIHMRKPTPSCCGSASNARVSALHRTSNRT